MNELQIHRTREEAYETGREQHAGVGRGPLVQRDFIGVFRQAPRSPEAVMDLVRREFERFSPKAAAEFGRCSPPGQLLQVGDEMEVVIRGTGCSRVRVVWTNERILSMRAIEGHPEAGRVSFGCFIAESGRMIFRIRARARINNLGRLVGYWTAGGKQVQTFVWTSFIKNVAAAIGTELCGTVTVRDRFVEDSRADLGLEDAPTFPAH